MASGLDDSLPEPPAPTAALLSHPTSQLDMEDGDSIDAMMEQGAPCERFLYLSQLPYSPEQWAATRQASSHQRIAERQRTSRPAQIAQRSGAAAW